MMPLLARLATLALVLQLVHVADHVRQGREAAGELLGAGLLGVGGLVAVLVLARRDSPLTGPAAAAIGLGTFAGFVAVHVLPRWSVFSDPYPEVGVDGVSWVLMAAGALAALGLGVAGWRSFRRGLGTDPAWAMREGG